MRDHRLYLRDIFAVMVVSQEFIGEMDFETFVSDDKTASAAINPSTKSLDNFSISCHNPYEVPSNPPRLTPPSTE